MPVKNDMSDYQRTARYNTSGPRAINLTWGPRVESRAGYEHVMSEPRMRRIIIIIIIITITITTTATKFSIGANSPYTSTDKNK